MNYNKLSLSFTGDDSYLERVYQEHFNKRNQNHFRFSCLLSMLFLVSWIGLDKLYFPVHFQKFLLLKLFLIFIFFTTLLASFLWKKRDLNQIHTLILVLLVGLSLCYMIHTIQGGNLIPVVLGLIVSYFFNYAFIRLRFLFSFMAGTALFVITLITFFGIRYSLSENIIQPVFYFLMLLNGLGFITSYTMELSFRKEFYLLESLEREKERHILHIEEKLHLDELTELYNRKGLDRYFKDRISFNRKFHIPTYIAYLDLDQLKYVNDSFGHKAGDLYIESLAFSIKRNLRGRDMGFRLGGDEFLVFLDKCSDGNSVVKRIYDDYVDKTKKVFQSFAGSFSYGIIRLSDFREMSTEDLIALADTLMLENKNKRKIQRGNLN